VCTEGEINKGAECTILTHSRNQDKRAGGPISGMITMMTIFLLFRQVTGRKVEEIVEAAAETTVDSWWTMRATVTNLLPWDRPEERLPTRARSGICSPPLLTYL
jgi:hypothetical protein